MLWAPKALAAKSSAPGHDFAGIDLNASRLRAVQGPMSLPPRPIMWHGIQTDCEELPLAVSLENRHPRIGLDGLRLSRLMPHLVCTGFLGFVGEERLWGMGRNRLDALGAMSLIYEKLRTVCAGAAIALALPTYLSRPQVQQLIHLAQKARLPLLACIAAPLANALIANLEDPSTGLTLIIDVDEHALSAAIVLNDDEQLFLQGSESWTTLGSSCWKNRLIDELADRCIRQSRRDPRECAQTEQHLFEQLENALDRCQQGKPFEILVQTDNWYQNLLLRPEDLSAGCHKLLTSAIGKLQKFLVAMHSQDQVHRVILTHAAARLPGLVTAVQAIERHVSPAGSSDACEDFGEDLIDSAGPASLPGPSSFPSSSLGTRRSTLSPDSAARGAHEIAGRVFRKELAPGYHDQVLPLPSLKDTPARRKQGFKLFSLGPDE
jgi:hypothetical protein